jgi:hypothetical protein
MRQARMKRQLNRSGSYQVQKVSSLLAQPLMLNNGSRMLRAGSSIVTRTATTDALNPPEPLRQPWWLYISGLLCGLYCELLAAL